MHVSDRRQSQDRRSAELRTVRPDAKSSQSVRDGLTRATHPAPAPRHVGAVPFHFGPCLLIPRGAPPLQIKASALASPLQIKASLE